MDSPFIITGPYSVGLHREHAEHPEREPGADTCNVAYVRGVMSDPDGSFPVPVEICTIYVDGSLGIAQRIVDALNAAESHAQGGSKARMPLCAKRFGG